jgi:hypothetical protein
MGTITLTVFHKHRLSKGEPSKQVWSFNKENDLLTRLHCELQFAFSHPNDMIKIYKNEVLIHSQNDKK